MDIKSLSNAIEKKIANPSDLDIAVQEMDAEVGNMALTCLKNSKQAFFGKETGVWEKLVNKVKEIAEKPYENIAPISAATALGGAGLGALAGSQMVTRDEGESKQDFEKRKRDMAMTAAFAGGALGAGTPSILNSLGVLGGRGPSIPSRIWGMIPLKDYVGASTIGAGGGYLAGKSVETGRLVSQNLSNTATKGLLENLQLANPKTFADLPEWKMLQSQASGAANSALNAGKGPKNLRSIGALLGIPAGITAYHLLGR